MFVDSWKLVKQDENKTGIRNLIDEPDGDFPMKKNQEAKYLGDILCTNGTNRKTVEDRKSKGFGAANKIISILEETCFGPYFFECAVILRNSLLINGILTNIEAWYGIAAGEIEILESVDLYLFRRIFEMSSSSPKEMFYLETGCLPISSIIVVRRLLFLHSILQEDPNSLIHRFFKSQLSNPVKGDWVLDVKQNLQDLEIVETIEEIQQMKINKFRKIVNNAIRKKTLKDLNKVKMSHSKVKHIEYASLDMQNYLKPGNLTMFEAKFAFHARCRMLKVRTNFSQSNSSKFCPLCKDPDNLDTQSHLLECEQIVHDELVVGKATEYDQLFSKNIDDQTVIIKMLKNCLEKRKKILEEEERMK